MILRKVSIFLSLMFIFNVFAQDPSQMQLEMMKKMQEMKASAGDPNVSKEDLEKQMKEFQGAAASFGISAEDVKKAAGIEGMPDPARGITPDNIEKMQKLQQAMAPGTGENLGQINDPNELLKQENIKKLQEAFANFKLSDSEKKGDVQPFLDMKGELLADAMAMMSNPAMIENSEIYNKYLNMIKKYIGEFYDTYIVDYEKQKQLAAGYYPATVKDDVMLEVEHYAEDLKKNKNVEGLFKIAGDSGFRAQTAMGIIHKSISKHDRKIEDERRKNEELAAQSQLKQEAPIAKEEIAEKSFELKDLLREKYFWIALVLVLILLLPKKEKDYTSKRKNK